MTLSGPKIDLVEHETGDNTLTFLYLVEELVCCLFSNRWEHRHGASTGLQRMLKARLIHRKSNEALKMEIDAKSSPETGERYNFGNTSFTLVAYNPTTFLCSTQHDRCMG
jgi:hypothetical protein